MGHDEQDTMKDYLSTLEHSYRPFYSKMMKCDFFHTEIRAFLQQYESTRKDWQVLWQTLESNNFFYIFSDTCAKFYLPSEHLVVYEVILLFRGWVIFREYISKKLNALVKIFTTFVT
jgi:hypothetical protein